MSAARDLDTVLRDQIDEIVRVVRARHADPSQDPVIVEIRYEIDRDWSGDEAIHFTVILRDPAGGESDELSETRAISEEIDDLVREHGIERIPYASFQLESERRALDAGQYYADDEDPS